ncbi:MAG: hypothetical protein AAF495_12440 [Pseudomonadota bacterium]
MIRPFKLMTILGLGLLWAAGPAWAGDEATTKTDASQQDMSAEEAVDNLVEDSKKTGEAISEGAKDAADWTEEKVKEATD